MSYEHLDGAVIKSVAVIGTESKDEWYCVGSVGVTRIEAFTKSGMHAAIPYVRVWKGDRPYAEFCQHNILGIYFYEDAREGLIAAREGNPCLTSLASNEPCKPDAENLRRCTICGFVVDLTYIAEKPL